VDTLASELRVSPSTVRRDLDRLEQDQLVSRTHGGAIWVGDRDSGSRPYAFDQRVDFEGVAKQQIAAAAAELVKPGETILLDGGTTTYHLARRIVGRSLQIITNSLPIADVFVNDEHVELFVTGGVLYPRYGVLLGPIADRTLQDVHANTLFMSVAGIRDGHLYNQNLLLVEAERRMIRQAQRVVLVADATKFGQTALARLGPIDEVDVVVTDSRLAARTAEELKAAGCRVIVAQV
jgi:DeoR/GlpR family transcriptional regulator of sugar metabolism